MRHELRQLGDAVRRTSGVVAVFVGGSAAAGLLHCSASSSSTPWDLDSGSGSVGASTDGPSGAIDATDQHASPGSNSSQAGRGDGGGGGGPGPDAGNGVAPAPDGGGGGGGAGHDAGQLEASGTTGDASSAGYQPCPTDGSNCKILPLGDSITYGIQYPGAYRVQLFQDAVTDHKKVTFVGDSTLANGPTMVAGVPFPQNNQGHSGWTIDQIKGLVPMPALADNPDIILLLIGTNDMYSQSQPVAQAPQRLGVLLDAIAMGDPHALLVVAQITPLQNSTWETNVGAYNAAIPSIVQPRASAGAHILMVDQHTGFDVSTMLSSDGVHPNQTGYNHMGDVWYAAIRDVLP
jgi:lysophospholipase L1-like esterase